VRATRQQHPPVPEAILDPREVQRLPRHGVVAGGDRLADRGRRVGHAQPGAGAAHRRDPRIAAQLDLAEGAAPFVLDGLVDGEHTQADPGVIMPALANDAPAAGAAARSTTTTSCPSRYSS
jgi:hypothetical protein